MVNDEGYNSLSEFKKDFNFIINNYQLLIYSYAWVIQDILGAAFCVNILKTLKLPNLKVSLKKNSFHSVML